MSKDRENSFKQRYVRKQKQHRTSPVRFTCLPLSCNFLVIPGKHLTADTSITYYRTKLDTGSPTNFGSQHLSHTGRRSDDTVLLNWGAFKNNRLDKLKLRLNFRCPKEMCLIKTQPNPKHACCWHHNYRVTINSDFFLLFFVSRIVATYSYIETGGLGE